MFLAVAALTGAGLAAFALQRVGLARGYAPEQPIAFSHTLHAGDYEIPCLYCHFGAETSRHAGIPPSSVCMNCHAELKLRTVELAKLREAVAQDRPIAWVKVHNLPDFVFFDHSQHVRVAGLDCRLCHGPVETMERLSQEAPLTMGWCLECHRERGMAEPAAGGETARPAAGGTDCSKCHY
jgi:hypothetical protein